MRVTYLGHQGWAFTSNSGIVLFDPIRSWMGNGITRLPVYPTRELDFSSMPEVRSIVLSHEHSDHFSLETLIRIPFRGKIYIPALSSKALESILQELGFSVVRLQVYKEIFVDGLRITPLPSSCNKMEIDVFVLLVRDSQGGSFITPIDAVPHPQLYSWIVNNIPDYSVLNLTNNHVEQLVSLRASPDDYHRSTAAMFKQMVDFVDSFKPKTVLITGQGWYFEENKKHFNSIFFNVEHESLLAAGRAAYPHIYWKMPQVGEILDFSSPIIHSAGYASFVIQKSVSPQRQYNREMALSVAFQPWCGEMKISNDAFAIVESFLTGQFGQIIAAYASVLTDAIFDLMMNGETGFSPTLAIILRNGTDSTTYEFNWGTLNFNPVFNRTRPDEIYAFGLELWASDLKLIIDADEEAFLVYESAVREWNHFPELVSESLCIDVFVWFSPRYRPNEFLTSYRRRTKAIKSELGII